MHLEIIQIKSRDQARVWENAIMGIPFDYGQVQSNEYAINCWNLQVKIQLGEFNC